MIFHKCHGAGNDFLVADNRDGSYKLTEDAVRRLCNRHTGFGADGLMLLENSHEHDFRMVFYNPDGSCGMMCGNGGRCIVAFAAKLGFDSFTFDAADGIHEARIVERDGDRFIIRLKMKDVASVETVGDDGLFLDTGTRHFVRFVDDVEAVDIASEGLRFRYDARFAPIGANVNFVSCDGSSVKVRTYEKGVEAETLACGTGIVATALASYSRGLRGVEYCNAAGESTEIRVNARIAALKVRFVPESDGSFHDVWLEGPAEFIGVIDSNI